MPSITRSSTPLGNNYQESRKVLPIIAKSVGCEHVLLSASTVEEHIDHSLVTLAKKVETCATKQDLKDVELGIFKKIDRLDEITHERFKSFRSDMDKRFDEVCSDMDKRFDEVDKRFKEVDKRFKEVDKRFDEVDKRFDSIDKRFDKLESKLESQTQHLQVQITNFSATQANCRLHRLHQPINLIKMFKHDPITNQLAWRSHPSVPKNVKRLYDLGHHAQSIFGPSWDRRTAAEKRIAEHEARNTIDELANFYDVQVFSDEQSESDATELDLNGFTVDEYMEALLDVWGMNWQNVINLVRQHTQTPKQHAGTKRQTETEDRAEDKRMR